MPAGITRDALLEELETSGLTTGQKAAIIARLNEAVAKEAAATARGNPDSKRAPKRTASAASAASAESIETKRCRTAFDLMADEWICPITQELPVDPVMAEDGRFYERNAIEQSFVIILTRPGPRNILPLRLAQLA